MPTSLISSMPLDNRIFAFLTLVVVVDAYTVFETTCTIPGDVAVNFVSSPDTRGTLDILWSCLFTILTCAWLIQYLNVPSHDEKRQASTTLEAVWLYVKSAAKGFFGKQKWVVLTILAPEFMLGKATTDYVTARRLTASLRVFAEDDGVQWSNTHSFFANMGGFKIKFEHETKSRGVDEIQRLNSSEGIAEARPAEASVVMTGPDLLWLRETGSLEHLPNVSRDEILDRSKGKGSDIFAILVVTVQIFSLAFNVIVRAAKGLAVSQLEIMASAFSLCSFLSYLILLKRPQDVQTTILLPITVHSSLDIGNLPSQKYGFSLGLFMIPSAPHREAFRERIPNDFVSGIDTFGIIYFAVGMMFGGLTFGSIHLAAWNFHFPSVTERVLWRASSLFVTCVLPFLFLPTVFGTRFDIPRFCFLALQDLGLALSSLYTAARLFLLVETFRTLLFLPPDAYVATWAKNVPHFS